MARRVAINLGQRTLQNNRGRGRGRGRRGFRNDYGNNSNIISKADGQSTIEESSTETNAKTDRSVLKPDSSNKDLESIEEESKIRIQSQNPESTTVETIQHIEAESPSTNPLKRKYEEIELPDQSMSPSNQVLEVMGFIEFNTTKNKHVKGTDCYGINFKLKTEYRQYINRTGGSNRTLSPTRGDKKKSTKIKISLKK